MKIESSSPGNNSHSTTHSTSKSTSTKFSTLGSTPGSTPHSTTSKPQNCEVEWDKNNVVATQLEGSWAVNKELTSVLYPSYSHSFPRLK